MQKLSWFYLLFMTVIIWIVVLPNEQGPETLLFPSELRVMQSDQSHPPARTSDLWQSASMSGLALSSEPKWLEFTFDFSHQQPASNGIFVSLQGAYTVYFNDIYIGSNGRPKTAEQAEVPGNIDAVFLIPSQLILESNNRLTIKITSDLTPHGERRTGVWVFADDYASLVGVTKDRVRLPMMMLSGLFIVALYSFIVYFTSLREPAYLWFSGLSLMLVLLIVAESWRGLFGYTYNWHAVRMEVVLFLTWVVSLLLPLFFVSFFRYSRKFTQWGLGVVFLIYAAVILFVDGYDYRSFVLFALGLGFSFVVGVNSIRLRKPHAWLMTCGLLVFMSPVAINRFSFMDQYFFVSFSCLALLLLLVLNQTHSERQKALIQSKLTTQRLELELIKKQVQPHFILNTLTAIEEWIDTAPQEAIHFIQVLATEFRQLAQLSNQSLVPMHEELALCRSHLKIMGYRFDADFVLTTADIDENLMIPPGVILTLIENAFSHNKYGSNRYVFALCSTKGETHNDIKLTSIEFSAQTTKSSTSHGTGVGSKYIKARLSEAFGSEWHFSEYKDEEHWNSALTFPKSIEKV